MKILHVNKFFDLLGGAEVYVHDLMRHQTEAGDEVHALSTRSPSNLPSPDASRFVTRYDLGRSNDATTSMRIAANFLWNREAKRAMTQALDEIKPDVVHIHNLYHHLSSSVLAPIRASGVPCVQTLHDLKLACPNYKMYTEGSLCERCKGGHYLEAVKHNCLSSGFLPNMLAALEMGMTKARQSYERTVHTFICPSDFMAAKMVEWGEPASKFRVVRMPVIQRSDAARDGGYLLAVGRLAPDKGYEDLIKVAARVPAVRIKIAGMGPLEDRLKSLIRSEGVGNVELVGFKRGPDLEALYRGAEAFLASPIGYENAPLTVLDALGYGLPIIASRIGGLPDMVGDGVNGFLVDHGSRDAWVTALKRFSSLDGPAKDALGSASRRMSREKYPDWDGHLAQIRDTYASVILPA